MSKICVSTNISILIFVSTCKQKNQSELMEFSKNGVFHSKAVVIIFSNRLNFNPDPTLREHAIVSAIEYNILTTATLRHFRPLLQKIYRNRIPENFLLTEIMDI